MEDSTPTRLVPAANGLELRRGEWPLGLRREILVRSAVGDLLRYPLTVSPGRLAARLGPFGNYEETLEDVGSAVRGVIRLEITSDAPFLVVCPVERPKSTRPPYFLVPGALYGTNNLAGTQGAQPQLDYGGVQGDPTSALFATRADRSTHPAVVRVGEGQCLLVGIRERLVGDGGERVLEDPWAPGFFYNGLFIDTSDPALERFGFTLGYEHAPRRHGWVWDNPRVPGPQAYRTGFVAGLSGHTLETTAFYSARAGADARDAFRALRPYYDELHQPPRGRATRDETLAAVGEALVRHSYDPVRRFFHLAENDEGRVVGDAAWTGGLAVAYPLLRAAARATRPEYRETAVDFIDNLCARAFNGRAGLFFEEHRAGAWQVSGWWDVRPETSDAGGRPLHSAHVNGQAAYLLLRCYEAEGGRQAYWLERARTVIETARRGQDARGAFAARYEPDGGRAVEHEGFQGCWFAAAVAALARLTGDASALEAAQRALEHYQTFLPRGELYGGALHARQSTEHEGILAFVIAAVELHRATGQARFLDLAVDGCDYDFSWKYAYNTALTNDPLRRLAWSSCGGNIASTDLPIVHPLGALLVDELEHVARATGDPYVTRRLRDTCVWALGLFNRHEREYGFGLKGQAPEQFFTSDALVRPWWRPWDGGVWEVASAWAAACALHVAAADLPDELLVPEPEAQAQDAPSARESAI